MTQPRHSTHHLRASKVPSFPLTTVALLAACSCLVASTAHAQDAALPEVRVTNVADTPATEGTGQYTARYPGSGYLVVGAPRAFSLSACVDF